MSAASSLHAWRGRAHPAGNRHGRRTCRVMAASSVAIAAPAPRVMPPRAATRQAMPTMPAPSCRAKPAPATISPHAGPGDHDAAMAAPGRRGWAHRYRPGRRTPGRPARRMRLERATGAYIAPVGRGKARSTTHAPAGVSGAFLAQRGASCGPACLALRPLQATARGGARKSSVATMPAPSCRAKPAPATIPPHAGPGDHDAAPALAALAGATIPRSQAWRCCRPAGRGRPGHAAAPARGHDALDAHREPPKNKPRIGLPAGAVASAGAWWWGSTGRPEPGPPEALSGPAPRPGRPALAAMPPAWPAPPAPRPAGAGETQVPAALRGKTILRRNVSAHKFVKQWRFV
jgi:hypothetical protein